MDMSGIGAARRRRRDRLRRRGSTIACKRTQFQSRTKRPATANGTGIDAFDGPRRLLSSCGPTSASARGRGRRTRGDGLLQEVLDACPTPTYRMSSMEGETLITIPPAVCMEMRDDKGHYADAADRNAVETLQQKGRIDESGAMPTTVSSGFLRRRPFPGRQVIVSNTTTSRHDRRPEQTRQNRWADR